MCIENLREAERLLRDVLAAADEEAWGRAGVFDADHTQRYDFLKSHRRKLRGAPLALKSLANAHRIAVRRARRRTKRLLQSIVARFAANYRATSAWLFIPEGSELLCARITDHTNLHGLALLRSDKKSVVAHVAREGKSYRIENVEIHRGPYRKTLQQTRSELAVPVVSPHDGELLGVLNLESNRAGQFTERHEQNLNMDVRELAVHLLCRKSFTSSSKTISFSWHPGRQGWNYAKILGDMCYEIRLSLGFKDDTFSTTLWYADWRQDKIFPLATTGFDLESGPTEMLELSSSHSGAVAALKRGTVVKETPETCRNFSRKEWAQEKGLTTILSTPVYRQEGTRSIGTLTINSFGSTATNSLPAEPEMQKLAALFGRVIDATEPLRRKVALAHLYWKMGVCGQHDEPPTLGWRLRLHTLKEVFKDLFVAGGCSIFLPDKDGNYLYPVATTGLRAADTDGNTMVHFHPENVESYRYDLKDPCDQGIMSYLYQHPDDSIVRLHSILNLEEAKGLPEDFPQRIVKRNMEYLERDTHDRRFLGMAITRPSPPHTPVIFRIVRSSQAAPFTEFDEELLRFLADAIRENDFWLNPEGSFVKQGT